MSRYAMMVFVRREKFVGRILLHTGGRLNRVPPVAPTGPGLLEMEATTATMASDESQEDLDDFGVEGRPRLLKDIRFRLRIRPGRTVGAI